MYAMNEFGKSIRRKLGYSFGANIVSLIVSVVSVSFVPKYMSVEDYGVYQLFLFYFGYVGFLHFGVLGGAIIRYAGRLYSELDYPMLKAQCIILFSILCICSIGLFWANFQAAIFDDTIIWLFVLSMVAQHVIWYSISMLQMSNRIEEASKLLLWERISWGTLAVGAVLCGYVELFYIILSYTVTRILTMLYSLYFIPEVVWAPVHFTLGVWKEFKVNFSVGFPITLSDICSILLIGIIRLGISNVWDISIFAKTSLALSFTFFFLTFVSSASVVLLPALKQIQTQKADGLYIHLNYLLSGLLLVILIGYFPLKEIIALWLPKYVDGLGYMGILFPALYFESKFNLLVATYLKKMLKTKEIFIVNLFVTAGSGAGCILFCYYLKNLTLSIILITLVLGIRCFFAEYILGIFLHIRRVILKEYLISVLVIGFFEYIVIFQDSYWPVIEYSLALIVYLLLSRKNIQQAWQQVKQVVTI